jgi:hypothetical protein
VTGAEFREVDIDLLADYVGGALTGTPDEDAVAALIADDPAWQAAYESLSGAMAAVGVELGRFEPEPMPDDVIARLDAALAAPSTPRLTLVPGDGAHAVHQVDETEPERGSKPGRARRLRWATPIAIAAGVIAFVGFGLDYLAGRDSADDSASSTAGGAYAEKDAAAIPPQLLSSGIDYSAGMLSTMPAAGSTAIEPFATPRSAASGAAPLSATNDKGNAAAEPDPLGRLHDPTALQECLDAIGAENAGGVISTQSVDFARFDGTPAIVVRFSAADGQWAWAAGADCGTGGDADTLGKSPVR